MIFSNVEIEGRSAFGASRSNAVLGQNNKKNVDSIVSALPWSSLKFEELLMNEVLPLLKDGGLFIQYMHTLSVLKGIMLRPILQKYFTQIDLEFVFFNIPPALVYTCGAHVKT